MATLNKDEEVPPICSFCKKDEEKVDLGILSMKIWKCVNKECKGEEMSTHELVKNWFGEEWFDLWCNKTNKHDS